MDRKNVNDIYLQNIEKKGDIFVFKLFLFYLFFVNIDRIGVYLMDIFDIIYLYVGSGVL